MVLLLIGLVTIAAIAGGLLLARVPFIWTRFIAPAASLPPYNLELSAAPEPSFPRWNRARIVAGGLLTIVLRPATPVEGPIEARAFLDLGDRAFRPFAIHFDRATHGTLIARQRPLPTEAGAGRIQIAILLGRPGSLPPDPATAERLPASADWALLDGEVEIDPR